MSTKAIRTFRIGHLRTTMRFEPEFWAALEDMAARERTTVNALVATAAGQNDRTSAVRVRVLNYYRERAAL